MARSRRSRSNSYYRSNSVRGVRDAFDISNSWLLNPRFISPYSSYLSEIEDRRTFHPEGYRRPARSFYSSRHALYPSGFTAARPSPLSPHVRFANPWNVLICVRRKIRREVMFAKGGAGSRRMRRPKHSEYSSVRC